MRPQRIRMHHRSYTQGFSVLVCLVLACATTQQAPDAPSPSPGGMDETARASAARPPATTTLGEDTTLSTPSGATFLAPKGWTFSQQDSLLRLQDPEAALTLLFVESAAQSAEQAVSAAWKRHQPDFQRAIKQSWKPPARDGWDEIAQFDFETAESESRVVVAVAKRQGQTWYVTGVDGTRAAYDKRAAQVLTSLTSFKAPGVTEESFLGKKAHPLTGERLKAFQAFVEEARQASHIPGVAISVVQNGRTVLERGFGVRDLGRRRPQPVTPKTLFLIGSMTKPLTTFMMARLVDEARFGWDTPVTQLHPSFALGDAETTQKLQMMHTVCACTGLPRQDMEFVFEYGRVRPEKRLWQLRDMKPTTGFGETFQYSNSLVSAGGYVAALTAAETRKGLGPAYDEVMSSRVLWPVGMRNSTFDFRTALRRNHAKPHARSLKLEYEAISPFIELGVSAVRPAGGAWSNVQDLSRYLQVELGKGHTPQGERLLSQANLLARRTPQVRISDKVGYGLGLIVEDDHGVQVVGHGGSTLGFSSDMFFLPEHEVGVVILTNAGGAQPFLSAVRRRLLELLFDGREEARPQLEYALEQQQAQLTKELEKLNVEPEPEWMAKWFGRYENAQLGRVTIKKYRGTVVFDAGEWKSTLAQKKEGDGTSKLVLTSPPFLGLPFTPTEADGRATLLLQLPQQSYEFVRPVPTARARR